MDSFDSLKDTVDIWAKQHKIPYTTKVAKGLKYRLGLNYPEHFTLFAMTWTGCDYTIKNAKKS